MDWATVQLVITLTVLAAIILGLMQEQVGPDAVMLSGLLVLVMCGVVKIDTALAGFANSSVITIGALYIVGLGLRSTGALEVVGRILLGRPSPNSPFFRLFGPIAVLSAFMNNTPLVAFMMPVFIQLGKKIRVSPSKLLIPLSYATILGGVCTLVGTSTNLVIAGTIRENGLEPMTMFELTPVGVPIAIVGLIYLATIGRRLLPDRQDLLEYAETHPREYTIEVVVRSFCPLAGNTVRSGGLRDLPGLYLYRIERQGHVISPVSPHEKIEAGDILCFSGVASTVFDLQRIRGLDPVEHRAASYLGGEAAAPAAVNLASLDSLEGLPSVSETELAAPRTGRQLCEVVISPMSPLVGQSIRDIDFRATYNAAIIAVHRSGQKLEQKIGQIVLHTGDTLLIDADDDFVRRWRQSADFILVSGIEDSAPVMHERAWIALLVFVGVVLGMSLFDSAGVVVALAGAVLMLVSRCVRAVDAQRSVELSILVLVAASFGISKAMENSGAAQLLAGGLLAVVGPFGPLAILATVYLLTMLLSELLSNNATAALMGGLVIAVAKQHGIDPRPLLIAVAIGASCAFATPIGYQTNLMVLNAGGYRFRDYTRVGLPLNLICFIVAMITIPLVYKLW